MAALNWNYSICAETIWIFSTKISREMSWCFCWKGIKPLYWYGIYHHRGEKSSSNFIPLSEIITHSYGLHYCNNKLRNNVPPRKMWGVLLFYGRKTFLQTLQKANVSFKLGYNSKRTMKCSSKKSAKYISLYFVVGSYNTFDSCYYCSILATECIAICLYHVSLGREKLTIPK